MTLDLNSKIVIVGGGTFGLSTALWLKRQHYQNVTVVDAYEIPSKISAANDINKIIQSSYTDRFNDSLAKEALQLWKEDDVFKEHFHDVGIVYCSVEKSSYEELINLNERRINSGRNPMDEITSPADFRKIIPSLEGTLPNWKGFYQKDDCGWAHAKNALISTAKEFLALGGKVIIGEVETILKQNGLVIGCQTKQGQKIDSNKLIISAGASSIKFFNFEDQMLAKCWTLAHIKLNDKEVEDLKNTPVLLNYDLGFFFEADANNEVKICNEFPGYTNYQDGKSNAESSIPISKDSIPLEAEVAIRDLLKQTLPKLATKKFVKSRICWCTDTPNRFFLIDEHPDYNGSLVVATGDSGHGFKFMPIVGKYISELVVKGRNHVNRDFFNHWKWRPETTKDRTDDRHGSTNTASDLKYIKSWI
ncbi:hypothetical protein BN7_3896 [Wickerhamomyces ciferrii]|uniref:FAD dependent oxidoreductase domain-containing protein n=1 Tax=Wickerhamomyces ciferrii (strain ATCC 14091 / BCRC 22168 / CBS 111 / JCM 3599 / NBRC 0793 / NRRL Y-1031 F-60-10) TaxID=1206466 RepID=K0KSL3_WICCF|nr:uncharacterized protein BN7_3896 [Wickerhamomyces ciferrii]CCH44334.1 hypothetical protein BN7_3896 [Wickerhamomyces ciferrii]